MKILLIEGAHELGGQARHVYDLAKGLLAREHNVTVACARPEAVSRLEKAGIPYKKYPFSSLFDVATSWSLIRLIRAERFDIVHSHGVRAGLLGRLAAKLAGGCYIVHTVHTMPEDVVPGKGVPGVVVKRIYRIVDSWIGCWTDRIITVSNDLKRRTICRHVSNDKITTIHSGVDVSEYSELAHAETGRHQLRLPTGCKVVGTIARFTVQKNLDNLIAAARIVCSLRDDVYFVLVGDGPEYERLNQVAQKFGLGHKVFMPGYIRDIAKVLPGFNVFALSSIYEGHPLSVLEAMAAGLPVVATNVTGIAETVVSGETGYIVPVGDSEALANALLNVLADDNKAVSMGIAGRSRVVSLFSLDKMLREIEMIYLEMDQYRTVGTPIGAVR